MPNAPFSTHVWKSHLTLTAACLCDCEIPILLRRNNKIGVLVDLLYGNSQNVVCDSKDLGLFNNCCVGECPRANFCYLWNKLLFSSRPFFFFGGPVRWRVDLPDCAKFGVLLARAAWLCQSLYLLLAACLEYLSLQLTTWSLLYQSRLRDILKLHNAFAACCDRGRNSRLLYSACLWRATPS